MPLIRPSTRALSLALATALALAACGADGPPLPPEPEVQPGVSLSGSARIGIAGGA